MALYTWEQDSARPNGKTVICIGRRILKSSWWNHSAADEFFQDFADSSIRRVDEHSIPRLRWAVSVSPYFSGVEFLDRTDDLHRPRRSESGDISAPTIESPSATLNRYAAPLLAI